MTRVDFNENLVIPKGEAQALSPLLHESMLVHESMLHLTPFRLETLKSRPFFKAATSGPRFSTHAFTMLRRPISDAETLEGISALKTLRFGFTVTKKIGGAVERNRIRRRLKAAVCSASPGFPDIGMDLVILARKEAMHISFPALVQDIARSVVALKQREGSRKPPSERKSTPTATKTSET